MVATKEREISSHAAAAKAIRAELKAAFPGVPFRVRSESFSMGDAVNVDWTDGPTRDSVENIVKKYQYGHFNGMEDIYENSNSREDIPQAKYVQIQRSISDAVRSIIKAEIAERFQIDMNDERKVMDYFGYWPDSVIRKEFGKRDFPAVKI